MEIGPNLETLRNWRNQLKIEEEQKEVIQSVKSQNQSLTQCELLSLLLNWEPTAHTDNAIGVDAGLIYRGLDSAALADFETPILFFPCPLGYLPIFQIQWR